MMSSRLSTAEIARRYAIGEPISSIAADAGITRIAIWKRLVAAGVPRTRTVIRRRHQTMRTMRPFCSAACYQSWVREQGAGYVQNRHGQRLARRLVAQYITIPAGAVIHHHDKNERHNELSNLSLFASHADHMSFHRGGKGLPIWDGRTAGEPKVT
jgi:hypothetical protein